MQIIAVFGELAQFPYNPNQISTSQKDILFKLLQYQSVCIGSFCIYFNAYYLHLSTFSKTYKSPF